MRGVNPATAQCERSIEDSRDPQLLEALNPADDVDHGVDCTHLMKRDVVSRHAMDLPFSLANQLEGPNSPLLDPARDIRLLDLSDQLADVPVRP
jgi:hypothetical protein